tara:strand:+ start:7982 stop:8281 length:300 start_codon:yes stop_codon:yes gene_type:complete
MVKFTIIKKLKTNNRFNYTPRYYKGKEDANPENFSTKIDMYSGTYNKNDFGGNWKEARMANRKTHNVEFNNTILIIIAILVLIFLFIIDFDLSIFKNLL